MGIGREKIHQRRRDCSLVESKPWNEGLRLRRCLSKGIFEVSTVIPTGRSATTSGQFITNQLSKRSQWLNPPLRPTYTRSLRVESRKSGQRQLGWSLLRSVRPLRWAVATPSLSTFLRRCLRASPLGNPGGRSSARVSGHQFVLVTNLTIVSTPKQIGGLLAELRSPRFESSTTRCKLMPLYRSTIAVVAERSFPVAWKLTRFASVQRRQVALDQNARVW